MVPDRRREARCAGSGWLGPGRTRGWETARGRGACVHQDAVLAGVLAKLEAHRPSSRGTRACNSPTSAASDRRVGGCRAGGGCGDAGSAPALWGGSPHLSPRGGRPRKWAAGPSVRAAGAYWWRGRRGRAPAGLPGGLFQDLDALSSARVGRTAI